MSVHQNDHSDKAQMRAVVYGVNELAVRSQWAQGSDQFVNSRFPILIRGDRNGSAVPSDENWESRINELVRSLRPLRPNS